MRPSAARHGKARHIKCLARGVPTTALTDGIRRLTNVSVLIYVFIFCLGLLFAQAAGGQKAAPLSPRRINEYAAALSGAERALLERPNLRRSGEALPDYCRRLVMSLPGEDAPRRKARINGYFAALERAAQQTADLRKPPALCDSSPENLQCWKAAAAAVAALPRHLQNLRKDLKREKNAPAALFAELTQTLYTVHAARESLRNARP